MPMGFKYVRRADTSSAKSASQQQPSRGAFYASTRQRCVFSSTYKVRPVKSPVRIRQRAVRSSADPTFNHILRWAFVEEYESSFHDLARGGKVATICWISFWMPSGLTLRQVHSSQPIQTWRLE